MTFLVIGAQKCATSWLYLCLREHPELHLPDRKREVEYLGGELHHKHGDGWYLDLISAGAEPGATCGDVSVEYLWDQASPAEVDRLLPDTRIVVSLRDPVTRAVSAYYWHQRKNRLPVDLPLASALEQGRSWLAGIGEKDVFPPSPVEELVARGRYAVQLARWLEFFPPERVLVVDYRDIQTDPVRALERVQSFLGVSTHRPQAVSARPKRNLYSTPLVRLERLFPRSRGWAALLDHAQRRWPGRPKAPVATLPRELSDGLYQAFRSDMTRLTELLGTLPESNRPESPSFARLAGKRSDRG